MWFVWGNFRFGVTHFLSGHWSSRSFLERSHFPTYFVIHGVRSTDIWGAAGGVRCNCGRLARHVATPAGAEVAAADKTQDHNALCFRADPCPLDV